MMRFIFNLLFFPVILSGIYIYVYAFLLII